MLKFSMIAVFVITISSMHTIASRFSQVRAEAAAGLRTVAHKSGREREAGKRAQGISSKTKAGPAKSGTRSGSARAESPVTNAYEFGVATVNPVGEMVERRKWHARSFFEELDRAVRIRMVEVPGGSFEMGAESPEGPCEGSEAPVHKVRIRSFSMGAYEVTQAQWRTVARWPRVHLILQPDPSEVEGDHFPVTNISCGEAREFCARLSNKTGRKYRLPSESEWEYACRAGTTTPFHFGETISPELANYNCSTPYESGPTGRYHERLMPVGSAGVANAFGLFDMHGNVWEWCLDPFHDGYNGAPDDGSVWERDGDPERRMLRGGCWNCAPEISRSASRNGLGPGNKLGVIGFRLALSN
ncbi:MAG: formylglycine-generating enzyme family protein [Acidobacteria bacterium]|nr:formylglycine-generating enzyme family protein [Acidobacteriota bacterium]